MLTLYIETNFFIDFAKNQDQKTKSKHIFKQIHETSINTQSQKQFL